MRSQSRASSLIRRRLSHALADVDARLAGAPDPDQEARHGDEADRCVALAEHEDVVVDRARLQTRRRLILAALDRIDRRVYGLCLECGAPIAPARLKALPEVDRCVQCQAGLEQAGRA